MTTKQAKKGLRETIKALEYCELAQSTCGPNNADHDLKHSLYVAVNNLKTTCLHLIDIVPNGRIYHHELLNRIMHRNPAPLDPHWQPPTVSVSIIDHKLASAGPD